jgi:hypothetical protein
MIEPHIDAAELRKKIIELFEYRMFPQLCALQKVKDRETVKALWSQLIDLQESIYHLDAHLEANWHVDNSVLDWHWKQISTCLFSFGIANERHGNYLAHIKKYQFHEFSLRKGKNLLNYNLEYFYFYKSCDVKLMRRLIYEQCGLKRKLGPLSAWRYFDLVTEVNDDVTDVFEDLDFVNGNLVLLSILKDGKDATIAKFSTFLDNILEQALLSNEINKKYLFASSILTQVQEQVKTTKELLIVNVSKVDASKSILLDCNLEAFSS